MDEPSCLSRDLYGIARAGSFITSPYPRGLSASGGFILLWRDLSAKI